MFLTHSRVLETERKVSAFKSSVMALLTTRDNTVLSYLSTESRPKCWHPTSRKRCCIGHKIISFVSIVYVGMWTMIRPLIAYDTELIRSVILVDVQKSALLFSFINNLGPRHLQIESLSHYTAFRQ